MSGNQTKDNENAEKSVVGVFVCRWGINIAGILDVPGIVEELNKLEGVKAYEYMSMWTEGGSEYIKEQIKEFRLERIVVAACTPKTHQPVFHAILTEANLPPRYLEFVNIREHCSCLLYTSPSPRD